MSALVEVPEVEVLAKAKRRRFTGEYKRSFCSDFFPRFNTEHHHSGLGLLTPRDVHCGLAAVLRDQRAAVLAAAHRAHPERFPHGVPTPAPLPTAVWINEPNPATAMSVDGIVRASCS